MSTDRTPMIVLGVTLAMLLGGGLVYRFYHTPASTGSNVVVVPAADGGFGQLTREVVDANQVTSDGAADAARSSLIAPASPVDLTVYQYVYRGQIDIPETVEVLERQGETAALDLLRTTQLGPIDLGRFTGASLQTVVATQSDGYRIEVDLSLGAVAITENGGLDTPVALKNLPVADSNVSDEQLVAVATAWLDQFGIDRSPYGTPAVVRDSFGLVEPVDPPVGMQARVVEDVAVPSAPEGIFRGSIGSVRYPLRLQNQNVFDLWGTPVGLTVQVDGSRQRVSSVYGLTSQRYRSSAYQAPTSERVLAVAKRGGLYGGVLIEGAAVTEIALREPALILANVQRFDGQQSHELFMPALQFPVADPPPGTPSVITVPLVADLLAESDVPVTGGGTSGSSPGAAEPAPLP